MDINFKEKYKIRSSDILIFVNILNDKTSIYVTLPIKSVFFMTMNCNLVLSFVYCKTFCFGLIECVAFDSILSARVYWIRTLYIFYVILNVHFSFASFMRHPMAFKKRLFFHNNGHIIIIWLLFKNSRSGRLAPSVSVVGSYFL